MNFDGSFTKRLFFNYEFKCNSENKIYLYLPSHYSESFTTTNLSNECD